MIKQRLFYEIIALLENNNVNYVIVGNTDNYPNEIGSDVDIVLPQRDINKFQQLVWSLENDTTRVWQMFQHEICAYYYILFDISSEGIVAIQPDICSDYYRNGKKLLSASYLLKGNRNATDANGKSKGFKTLSPAKEFIYYLLKKVDKQHISDEQFTHLHACYKQDVIGACEEINEIWSTEGLKIICKAFDNCDISLIVDNIVVLQKEIHKKKGMTFGLRLKNSLLKIKRIWQPTGYVIAIMGPDGSGKSTVLEQLKKDVAPAFRKIKTYHLFPVENQNKGVNTDPHQQKPRGFVVSLFKLFYFLFLYNSGFLKLILPKKIRSTLIVFDRYYDDILIDPIRYRNGTSTFWIKLIGLFIPQPNLWFVLDAPAELIQQRKAEVPYSETERQRTAYKKFAEGKKNAFLIDTNRTVDDISKDICIILGKKLNQRAIKRYKK